MLIKSRLFGEISVEDDKVITFEKGIIGFEEFKSYAIVYDSEKKDNVGIMWLQSTQEPQLAFPVMDPLLVDTQYNPVIEDEQLKIIGENLQTESIYVLSILTVPSDISKMTINLKAPLLINTESKKGCQIIVGNDEYEVRHEIYQYFSSLKEEEGTQC